MLSTRLANVPKGFYVKEVTLGGVPVNGNRLPVGGMATGAELRISIGRDGGFLSVQVQRRAGQTPAGCLGGGLSRGRHRRK